MIKGAIFDVDGTLFDSMFIWDTIGGLYLESLGITPAPDINETFKTFTLYDAALFYQREYGVTLSVDEIVQGVNRMVEHYYRDEVQLKPGTAGFLRKLKDRGVKMSIATATDDYLVEAALRRCGVFQYFSGIFTCGNVGHGKDEPIIYREAMKHMGTEHSSTYVFEDTLYAAETAKKDGFNLTVVYDKSEKNQGRMEELANIFLQDFTDFDTFWKLASV